MVAYSFQKQFAAPILSGRKSHTIRAPRKRHARPGEALQLYTGMRTKHCRLVARAMCEAVVPVIILFRRDQLRIVGDSVQIDGRTIAGRADLDAFADSDGFADWLELRAFWEKHHGEVTMFQGLLIKWRDMVPGL